VKETTHYIVLVENYWEGFWQSITWLAVLTAGIALAIHLQSSAMQWVLSVLWFISMLGWAVEQTKRKRMTLADAEKRLNEIRQQEAE
jgi:hypothetical protein